MSCINSRKKSFGYANPVDHYFSYLYSNLITHCQIPKPLLTRNQNYTCNRKTYKHFLQNDNNNFFLLQRGLF